MLSTILVGIGVAAVLMFAGYSAYRGMRKGGCSGCSGCKGCGCCKGGLIEIEDKEN